MENEKIEVSEGETSDEFELKDVLDVKKSGKSSVLLLSGFITTAVFLFIFGVIAEDVLEQETFTMDTVIINWLHSFKGWDTTMYWITESGSAQAIILLSLVTIFSLYRYKKGKIDILFFILTVAGGALLNYVLKLSFQRVRPSINQFIDAVGFSFPSGHSMGSMIFYGIISYFIIRSQRSITIKVMVTMISFLFITMIGISRIYLNAHYPSDVIAGYLAGFIWLLFCIFTKIEYKKRFIK